MTATKCSLCHKKIEIRVKECDESGMTWHCYCFRCYVCGVLLNENNVKIRGDDNKLYCGSHAILQVGNQPTSKIYGIGSFYRVTF